tara:strand:- start:47 stop:343 length:297 start_codon:yes stop_codon:yes gene_type:complete
MNETWDLIRNITEVVGMFAIPVFSWVVYTLVQQGKQIIVLEQKVNESINQRLERVEKRVSNVEEKLNEIGDNVVECKISSAGIISKIDSLAQKIDDSF